MKCRKFMKCNLRLQNFKICLFYFINFLMVKNNLCQPCLSLLPRIPFSWNVKITKFVRISYFFIFHTAKIKALLNFYKCYILFLSINYSGWFISNKCWLRKFFIRSLDEFHHEKILCWEQKNCTKLLILEKLSVT